MPMVAIPMYININPHGSVRLGELVKIKNKYFVTQRNRQNSANPLLAAMPT